MKQQDFTGTILSSITEYIPNSYWRFVPHETELLLFCQQSFLCNETTQECISKIQHKVIYLISELNIPAFDTSYYKPNETTVLRKGWSFYYPNEKCIVGFEPAYYQKEVDVIFKYIPDSIKVPLPQSII